MLFSSFTFIFAFLPIVWAIFHLLKREKFKAHYRFAKIFLIISSLFFYAFWKVAYLPILLSSIIVNYFLAKAILKHSLVIESNAANFNGGGGGNHSLKSNKTIIANSHTNSSISSEKSGLRSHEQGNRTSRSLTKRVASLPDLSPKDEFAPKFFFTLGIIFNLSLLAFFKYTDFLLENFNAFSKLAHLDFNIPLPHILLPLALSFVTFQQIAFLFDCYKRTKGELNENLHIDFIDYALFISFFPQLIAGPIVHHREMMPQFARLGNSSLTQSSRELEKSAFNRQQVLFQADFPTQPTNLTQDTRIANDSSEFASCNGIAKSNNPSLRGESMDLPKQSTINYEYLAKGIFIFSIGLFKKAFIADSFAKWANVGFSVVGSGGFLNIAESWATSLSYTFQLYFDFSGYCDMAMGLALMFGIVLPLNFDSPYKSLNISEFWRRWHITLGRFLRECLYIPLGGNRGKGNSSLTQSSRELEKSAIDRQQALSHLDFSTQPTNLTQDTRIANDSQKQSYITKILTLRNLFIVAFLSGIWHGAGFGFIIWGILHGIAMMIHRIYSWILERLAKSIMRCHTERSEVSKNKSIDLQNHLDSSVASLPQNDRYKSDSQVSPSLVRGLFSCSPSLAEGLGGGYFIRFTKTYFYKILCWFITFNFVNLAWIFFRAENLNGAVNLIKGMFGFANLEIPHKWSKIFSALQGGTNEIIIWIVCAFVVCLACGNSFEMVKNFDTQYVRFRFSLRIFNKKIYLKGGAVWTRFVLTIVLFYTSIWILLKNVLDSNAYTPFLYFNF